MTTIKVLALLLFVPAAPGSSVLAPLDGLEVDTLLDHLPQRRHLPQLLHVLRGQLDRLVHLLNRREPTQSVPDARVRHLLVHAQRPENVRRLERRAGARAPAAHRDLLQTHQQRLALDVREGHVDVAGVPSVRVAVQLDVLALGADSVDEALGKHLDVRAIVFHLLTGDRARLPEADAERGREGARAQAALLAPAGDERLHPNPWAAANVDGADALGAVDLVPGDGEQVDLHVLDVDRDLTHRLRGVGVEEHLVGAAHLANLFQRLDDSDFVVHRHHRNHRGFRSDRGFEFVEVDQTVGLDREVRHVPPLLLEVAARV